MQSTVVFSVEKLMKLVNNDRHFARHLLDVFITTAHEELNNIALSRQKNDWVEIGLTFHKIKASVKLLGMDDLAKLLNEGEEMAKKDPENPRMLFLTDKAVKMIESAAVQFKNITL